MFIGRSAWKALPVALLVASLALAGCAENAPVGGKSLAALVALAPPGEGGLQATQAPVTPEPGRFEFVGIVQSADAGTITVGGQSMAVDAQTEIDPALKIGDRVEVSGYVLADGSLLAAEVHLAEQDAQAAKFEWSGQISSIDGTTWVVGGMTFTVDVGLAPAGAAVGMWVKVEGTLGPDGQWVITSMELESHDDDQEIEDSTEEDEVEDDVEDAEVEDDIEEVEEQDDSQGHEHEAETEEQQDHSGAEHTGGDD